MPAKKTPGSLTKETRKEMPPRGKAKKTLMLDAIKAVCGNEKEFLEKVVSIGLGGWTQPEQKEDEPPVDPIFHPSNPALLTLVLNRIEPPLKAISPNVEFTFRSDAKPHEQAADVMTAIASGEIPADIGQIFITSISSMLKIQELTDFEERLKAIEDASKQD